MSQLTTFVPPTPNRLLMSFMTGVNRTSILGGLPGLKHVIGFRPLTRITHIDFPIEDAHRLRTLCQPGKATFIAPVHPEFFTDWMIDKYILAKTAPMAASWATHGVVNGMGKLMQRFWLGNNLIAQIPGASDHAIAHSVEWASRGHGVLLHPEGQVGWHGNYVAPVRPGAVQMAQQSLTRQSVHEAWIVPVVWKIVFNRDVEDELMREYRHIRTLLNIEDTDIAVNPARAVHQLYDELLAREEQYWFGDDHYKFPYRERHASLIFFIEKWLRVMTNQESVGDATARNAKKWLRQNLEHKSRNDVQKALRTLERLHRLGDFAWSNPKMTQEEVAEHLKRIRCDYCTKGWRNKLHAFVPRPVGPRSVFIRVAKPIAVHNFSDDTPEQTTQTGMRELQSKLQHELDLLNVQLYPRAIRYENPFF